MGLDIQEFLNKYLIDQVFDIWDDHSGVSPEYFNNSMTLIFDFESFNDIYKISKDYKNEIYGHYFQKGWTSNIYLKIYNYEEPDIDLEISLVRHYKSNDKVFCLDITDIEMLKILQLNHLNIIQELMFYADSKGFEVTYGLDNLLIIFIDNREYFIENISGQIFITDRQDGVTHKLKQNTLEEIKSFLFPKLMRKEKLETLTE